MLNLDGLTPAQMREALALAELAYPAGGEFAGLTPFTIPHWRAWAGTLTLDNGQTWVPEPFQDAFVEDVFAGVPECWLIVPESSGKSTLLAGIALYVSEFSPRPAEIPVAAASREQAGILYMQAEGFVLRSKRMYEPCHSEIQAKKGRTKVMVPRFNPLSGFRRIEHVSGSRIQILAADERTGDGVMFTLAIIDELHRHRDLDLYRTWSGKRLKRGGQIVAISTAGEPGGDFELTRERIRQSAPVVDRSETFLRAKSAALVLHQWAVPEDGDVEDMELVARANPLSSMTAEVLRGKFDSPTMTLSHWKRLTCNLPTRSDDAAITEAEWAAATWTEAIPENEPIWLGLDVAWKWDTTAAVPLWVRDDEFCLFGPARVLVPPRDGTSLDPSKIERALLEVHARNPVHTVVMDTNRAEQLGKWIEQNLGAKVIDRVQTNAFASEDFESFMGGLRGGTLHHSGDQGLTQHVLNAITKPLPAGKTVFERPHMSRGGDQTVRVIDALVAAAMVHRMATAVVEDVPVVEPWVAFG